MPINLGMDTGDYNLNLLALDAALEYTGYAVYRLKSVSSFLKLEDIGLIKTDADCLFDSRLRFLLYETQKLIYNHSINCVILEKPPETIYGGGHVNIIKGRASSVFKVYAACFTLFGMLNARDIYCRLIEPSQWQINFKGKPGLSKIWSVKQANQNLSYLGYPYRELVVNAKGEGADGNIADAINIGFKAIHNYDQNLWELPSECRPTSGLPL